MTELHQISVKLSEGQKRKLSKAYRNREEISLRLSKNALSGSNVLMVPMNTVKSDFLRVSRIGRHSRKIDFSFISPKHTFG